jgi:2-amino-4-hydroxy-6-hydroxymethyldihydropteridine diphosphokinase
MSPEAGGRKGDAGGASRLVVLPDWAQVGDKRLAHIERVAELVGAWAEAMHVDNGERERWLRAVSLHDALKDGPSDLLSELAPDSWDADGLRHGPAAAAMAARAGERDQGVLDAVRYHSVGCADWDAVGRMLYLADFLEPGRRKAGEDREALVQRVPDDPRGVLWEVARRRLLLTVSAGHPLLHETVAFWNDLVCGDE